MGGAHFIVSPPGADNPTYATDWAAPLQNADGQAYCATQRLTATSYYARALARSVRLTVPLRSCLGYRHAGCLQPSHRRPPEMCGLRSRPRTDVDRP